MQTFVRARFAASRDLTRSELHDAAAAIAARRALWQAHIHHDPERRNYTQLHRNPHLDIWLICWTNQQDTGFHDHDISAGAVQIVEGELVEDRFEFGDSGLHEVSTVRRLGETFDFDASHVHRLRHERGALATSIHVYSPALWRMGYYDADAAGLFRRTSVSYAEELGSEAA